MDEGSKQNFLSLLLSLIPLFQDGMKKKAVVGVCTLLMKLSKKLLQSTQELRPIVSIYICCTFNVGIYKYGNRTGLKCSA